MFDSNLVKTTSFTKPEGVFVLFDVVVRPRASARRSVKAPLSSYGPHAARPPSRYAIPSVEKKKQQEQKISYLLYYF
jgi:hypothetical protein